MHNVYYLGRTFVWIGTMQDVLSRFVFVDASGMLVMQWDFSFYYTSSTGALGGHFLIHSGQFVFAGGVVVIDAIDINGVRVATRLGDQFIVDGELQAMLGIRVCHEPVVTGPYFKPLVDLVVDVLVNRLLYPVARPHNAGNFASPPPSPLCPELWQDGDELAAPPDDDQAGGQTDPQSE